MKTERLKRDEMIEKNLGLVHACANRFRGRGVEYDDLFQAGCVGLVKAAEGFDETLGYNFSTYAFPVILGEIKRIFRDSGTIKIGRALKEKIRLANKLREDFLTENGYEPTISEMAKLMDTDVMSAAQVLCASMPIISLTMQDDEESRQLDVPVSPPDEEISEKLALEQTMETLEEKERQLIELRYFKGMTQSKTAQILGISQVQVSRKEKKILLKMRNSLI
ncbi:MAG: sigma-70 family RNA polymerase sigma factor [Clostridia bacterium]|nr:sigma-70 family RNA polymerase sigma factor [Clostridia bacterium]